LPLWVLQVVYKEAVKKELPCPVYHQLADTPETQLARELTDMQSQVRGPGPGPVLVLYRPQSGPL